VSPCPYENESCSVSVMIAPSLYNEQHCIDETWIFWLGFVLNLFPHYSSAINSAP